ncbi:MAG: hypothetical protein RR420_00910 [Anaerovoracaceae bacterium]
MNKMNKMRQILEAVADLEKSDIIKSVDCDETLPVSISIAKRMSKLMNNPYILMVCEDHFEPSGIDFVKEFQYTNSINKINKDLQHLLSDPNGDHVNNMYIRDLEYLNKRIKGDLKSSIIQFTKYASEHSQFTTNIIGCAKVSSQGSPEEDRRLNNLLSDGIEKERVDVLKINNIISDIIEILDDDKAIFNLVPKKDYISDKIAVTKKRLNTTIAAYKENLELVTEAKQIVNKILELEDISRKKQEIKNLRGM